MFNPSPNKPIVPLKLARSQEMEKRGILPKGEGVMGKEEPYVDPEKTGGDALHNVSWVLSVPSPKTIYLALLLIVGCLTLASLAGVVFTHVLGHGTHSKFVNLFNLDGEMNVPAWYSSSTLLLCSILLGLIANHKMREGDGYSLHWVGLARDLPL